MSHGATEIPATQQVKENANHHCAAALWTKLTEWINNLNSGYVHPDLSLQSFDSSSYENRTVVATRSIPPGSLLIRLPVSLDGRSFPQRYHNKILRETVNASPWLRCLAAYYQAASSSSTSSSIAHQKDEKNGTSIDWKPYLDSLPLHYETLFQWTEGQRASYLAGTTLQQEELADSILMGREKLQERYETQVRPYLEHCRITLPPTKEEEMTQFQTVCQAISTRCFHLKKSQTCCSTDSQKKSEGNPSAAADVDTNDDGTYDGPFFLPVIDLLNHHHHHHHRHHPARSITTTNDEISLQTCTTLCREGGHFVMRAERFIEAQEQILHSYGDDLTAAQFLQTFGFVPLEVCHERCRRQQHTLGRNGSTTPTFPTIVSPLTQPAISQPAIWQACWNVIESGLPQRLAQSMNEQGFDKEESWEVHVDRTRTAPATVSDPLFVEVMENDDDDATKDAQNNSTAAAVSLLSDEWVTIASLAFLPKCAYAEAKNALLDRSLLQDYYLGKLVGTALLQVIQDKLATYTAIPIPDGLDVSKTKDCESNNNNDDDDDDDDADILLMQALLADQRKHLADETERLSCQRLLYGLTVRVEEKLALQAFRRQVIWLLTSLDQSEDDEEEVVAGEDSIEQPPSKKSRAE